MDRQKRDWAETIRLCRGGHRVFIERVTRRVAVADNSGRTPEETEDGTLWVDTDKPLEYTPLESSIIRIPFSNGFSTGEDLLGAVRLMKITGQHLKIGRHLYRLVEVA